MAYNLQVGHIANGDLQIVLGMSPIPFFQQDVEEKDGIRRAVHRAFPETQAWAKDNEFQVSYSFTMHDHAGKCQGSLGVRNELSLYKELKAARKAHANSVEATALQEIQDTFDQDHKITIWYCISKYSFVTQT